MKVFKYEELLEKANQIKNDPYYPECKDMSIDEIINSKRKRYSIVVDHIDRNPINNKLENLRWYTLKENSTNTSKSKKVYQYTLSNVLLNIYTSMREASRKTNIDNSNISKVCNNIKKNSRRLYLEI